MKRNKVYVVLLSLFVLMLSLTGCGTKEEKEADNIVTAKSAYPVTVKDSDGKEVTLEEEPMRIVSISPSITEIIYSLGVSEKLVARTNFCDYPEEVLSIESIGDLFTQDIERIMELEPDLVITSAHLSESSIAMLNGLGTNVLTLYEEHNFEGVYTMFETLGTALNASKQANDIVKKMKEEILDIQNKIKDFEPKTVYYMVGFGELGDYTAGGDTYIHSLIELAGADNIAKNISEWKYSLESLLEADPEYIILGDYAYDEFISTEPYNTLSAVVNGRVYPIDVNKLDRQSYRNVEAIREIAGMLYPEAFLE